MTDDTRGAPADDPVESTVQAILSVIPGGCTWLQPILDGDGQVVDFRIAATGDRERDIYGRGATRVDSRLRELYPSMVDGPLWRLYLEVLASGVSGRLSDFRYEERRAGVVADSLFDVSVHPALGGLLVWWQRLDEDRLRLERTELLGRLGWAEYDLATGVSDWSPGMYRIFDRDPALGPMSRAEQASAMLADDRGLSETAWQTLDSGAASDVTVRFQSGGSVKYLRVLSDLARDADGNPLKIYAVVQDVTTREESRTTCRPRAPSRWAATGITRRACRTARSCSRSATWPGTGWRPRVAWRIFATRWWPGCRPASSTRESCRATSTGSVGS